MARCVTAHIDISSALGLGVPPAAADILTHLAPFNVGTVGFSPGPQNFTVTQNWRFTGDYHMGSAPDVESCEAACAADGKCACFTFCPSPSVSGCPDGPSCWFYSGPTGGMQGPALLLDARREALLPSACPSGRLSQMRSLRRATHLHSTRITRQSLWGACCLFLSLCEPLRRRLAGTTRLIGSTRGCVSPLAL